MALPVLQLENLELKYGSELILENVNLSVEKGERIAVVGPSGQGKSSLLKMIAGLREPTRGRVFVEGRAMHELEDQERQALRCRMGMLFQKNALFDSLKVGENVAFPLCEATRASTQEIDRLVQEGLESVGLGHVVHLFPDEISGGMQKRLGIARAQALNPDYLFYDDPTAGLDPITSRKIVELIVKLQNERQSTIIVITNEIARAYQLAHRIWFVEGRKVLDLGSPEQARSHHDLRVQQFLKGEAHGPLLGGL